MTDTADFFRARLDQMIDPRHPLLVLESHMPWQEIETALGRRFERQTRRGKNLKGMDLFGFTTTVVSAGSSNAGRPRLSLRLMASLLYLKHAFNESDEGVCHRWGETPAWQYFSGEDYFENRPPCDPSSISRFRRLLGEEGVEELLARTISVAVTMKLIDAQELATVIVDSTVQPKAIAYPTDSRLLETARQKLVDAAKAVGIAFKQTYAKEGAVLSRKAGRYAHARQFHRMKKAISRQRTILGRLARHVERCKASLPQHQQDSLASVLDKVWRIAEQSRQKKAVKGQPKLYSWHAPEVSCISKGKARQPYEFGVKVGIATTLRGNLIVGARSFAGNPYDGHTLAEQIEQATILMQETDVQPTTVYTDLGYRGVDKENPNIRLNHRGKFKRLTPQERQQLKRRQAIEPMIGHLKHDHRMERCHLKGQLGDAIHAVLCAAGYNIKWLLRMIVRYGLRAFLRLFFAPQSGLQDRNRRPIIGFLSQQSTTHAVAVW